MKIPTTKETVAKYGWKASDRADKRHRALRKAIKKYGPMQVYRHLIARSTQWRTTDLRISALFRRDAEYVKRIFITTQDDPSCKYDPWTKSIPVKARLLYLPKARAGLRQGKQVFTDLVEVGVRLPGNLYEKFAKSKAFTPYKYGLARRGRSRRGTNIFLLKARSRT